MIAIQTASLEQKSFVRNLMQLYQYDLSEFDGTPIDNTGTYSTYKYFDLYWVEPQRYPYLIYDDLIPIGFALVRELTTNIHSIAEFFVIRSARSKGNASVAASKIFDLHPGEWHIAQQQENTPAQAFWKSAITNYTNGAFKEVWSDTAPTGPKQIFKTTT